MAWLSDSSATNIVRVKSYTVATYASVAGPTDENTYKNTKFGNSVTR